jgi:hypothetical protein
MYKAKIAVCSEIRTKHSAQIEYHVEFLTVKPGLSKETARLLKVNSQTCRNECWGRRWTFWSFYCKFSNTGVKWVRVRLFSLRLYSYNKKSLILDNRWMLTRNDVRENFLKLRHQKIHHSKQSELVTTSLNRLQGNMSLFEWSFPNFTETFNETLSFTKNAEFCSWRYGFFLWNWRLRRWEVWRLTSCSN